MIKIESVTLEQAYKDAAAALKCSASELIIEVVQVPSSGFMGLFKKNAIIVAAKKTQNNEKSDAVNLQKEKQNIKAEEEIKVEAKKKQQEVKKPSQNIINDTIMPESFVSMQEDDDYYDMADINFTADYEEDEEEKAQINVNINEIAKKVEKEINELFTLICFKIDKIDVSVYDENTLLIEFKGEDAALLIGKEGYRYKALSYMIFNWINTKYQLQLRLEIAEFLKNQEESIMRYLINVYENIDRDGRAQTKILDGVLIQIALKELRDKYPNKYVAVRSTRDGLKFIIINDYHN
ncbi:protein jag [Sulfurimonas sp. CVO]|jgi:spoIIIJ-associated protein|uniref:Protein jag n=1 Tax=Sulfurimonas xiamenensis TaxID=2590021 RepID=A0AAJ4A2P8_9BACT|nr:MULTISPECIES: Jag N-terminal domain-containing protein [Sulfurimonas]QFR42784.1 protein jag [Sulfurimonas xiamenensis]QHG91626.1 protein jag [Sulfurimonas sp. CVO]